MVFSTLPEDCTIKIVSYLPLHYALRYASASKDSMEFCIADFRKRRRNISQTLSWSDRIDNSSSYVFRIPSALERLKCLRQSLNHLHPLRDNVHELIVDIEAKESEVCLRVGRENDAERASDFTSRFHTYQGLLNGHKLHSTILKSVLYNESMMETNDKHGKVPLHLYIGDMLIIYFCMGHAVSNVIEGISETKWVESLKQKLEHLDGSDGSRDQTILSANDWYRLYVCLHSTLVRNAPLLRSQMIQLGIANETMMKVLTLGKDCDANTLIPQPNILKGAKKEDLMVKINENELCCHLTSTIYEFGPLGPAFRGRDNVSHIYFNPVGSVVVAISNFWKHPLGFLPNMSFFGSGEDLMRACRESKKLHPMNVEPPLLTFDLMHQQ